MPGFAEYFVPHEESLVADELFGEKPWLHLKLELILLYGSLSRPPESCSSLVPSCTFTDLVCMWFQTSLSKNIASGSLEFREYIVGDDAFWHNLEARYVHREGELWLEKFRQNPACDIVDIICLDLAEAIIDFPAFFHVIVAMLLMSFGGLRVIAPHIDGLYIKDTAAKILQSVLKLLDQVNHALVIGFKRMDKLSPLLIVDGKWLDFWIDDFKEGASICVSKELISITNTWSLHGFFLITIRLNDNGDEDSARQWIWFSIRCKVFLEKKSRNFGFIEFLYGYSPRPPEAYFIVWSTQRTFYVAQACYSSPILCFSNFHTVRTFIEKDKEVTSTWKLHCLPQHSSKTLPAIHPSSSSSP
ncbi:unnamed protein product [Arabis nemorensis]|uniref:Uncharacterized protein n=1 Tax=Arabis nemorensis TaxID=586526 RepID=A0A565CE82_9BRAS|nr:unnamed protein product [Arabis nemorensis]